MLLLFVTVAAFGDVHDFFFVLADTTGGENFQLSNIVANGNSTSKFDQSEEEQDSLGSLGGDATLSESQQQQQLQMLLEDSMYNALGVSQHFSFDHVTDEEEDVGSNGVHVGEVVGGVESRDNGSDRKTTTVPTIAQETHLQQQQTPNDTRQIVPIVTPTAKTTSMPTTPAPRPASAGGAAASVTAGQVVGSSVHLFGTYNSPTTYFQSRSEPLGTLSGGRSNYGDLVVERV